MRTWLRCGAGLPVPARCPPRSLSCMQATAIYTGWRALQGLMSINRFWGIITVGWVPGASLAAASLTTIAAIALWYATNSKGKAVLLGGQVALQLLCAATTLLALLCWVYPAQVDPQVGCSLARNLADAVHVSSSSSASIHQASNREIVFELTRMHAHGTAQRQQLQLRGSQIAHHCLLADTQASVLPATAHNGDCCHISAPHYSACTQSVDAFVAVLLLCLPHTTTAPAAPAHPVQGYWTQARCDLITPVPLPAHGARAD